MADQTNDRSRETIVAFLKAENNDLRQELAELADIVRVLADASRSKYAVWGRIDNLIDRLIGAGLGPDRR